MKQKPKVGELVRIVSARPEYHNGEIAVLRAVTPTGRVSQVQTANDLSWLCDEVERVPQKGDLVVVKNCSVVEAVGAAGTVVYPSPKDFAARTAACQVKLDHPVAGRDRVFCPLTYGVELLAPEKTPKKETVKVGDRVRIVAEWPDGHCSRGRNGKVGTCVAIDKRDKEFPFGVDIDGDIGCAWVHSVELVAEKKPPRQIIHITTDGKTTTATLREGKKVLKTASAKCSPGDTFSFAEGARIAFERLQGREPFPKPEPYSSKAVCVETIGDVPYTVGKVYRSDGERFFSSDNCESIILCGHRSGERNGFSVAFSSGAAFLVPLVED